MIISDRWKFIFIAIPKTGTTAIETYCQDTLKIKKGRKFPIGDPKLKHTAIRALKSGHGEVKQKDKIRLDSTAGKFDSYYKFATLRNPWDRAVSQFFYRKRPKPSWSTMSDTTNMTFQEYVLGLSDKARPQWDYITDSSGRVLLDGFIRFENLQGDFKQVCNKLDIPFEKDKFVRRNVSPRTDHKKANFEKQAGLGILGGLHQKRPYWQYYTDETREHIGKLCKKEINMFGFKFMDLK